MQHFMDRSGHGRRAAGRVLLVLAACLFSGCGSSSHGFIPFFPLFPPVGPPAPNDIEVEDDSVFFPEFRLRWQLVPRHGTLIHDDPSKVNPDLQAILALEAAYVPVSGDDSKTLGGSSFFRVNGAGGPTGGYTVHGASFARVSDGFNRGCP